MPTFDLIPLLVQTGYAGLFIALLVYVLREQAKREARWIEEQNKRETAWTKERDERHRELVKLSQDTLSALNGIKLVMQQWFDESRPPFVEWDGQERRRKRP